MSYAKSHPDLAILGINTLRKVIHNSFRMPLINIIHFWED